MAKCINLLCNRMTHCIKKTFSKEFSSLSEEEEVSTLKGIKSNKINKGNTPYKIIQKSSFNSYAPQGNYKKLENYNIFKNFINKPLVKIYIEEIFLPNKEIKEFQVKKITGIYDQIKEDLEALFSHLGMELKIPEAKYYLSTDSFEITCSPATQRELDIYTPLLMLEWWIYPKKFIQKAEIKALTLVHDISFKTESYTQDRKGCPEYKNTKSIVFSVDENNFAYIRIVLHHEFFHFIDYADDKSYDDDEFENLNEEGFEYGEGGDSERQWIKLDKNMKGFINHYSTTDLAEDRAEIYQYLIGCPDEALNNGDIIVRKKAKRIQDFLNNFDKEGMGNPKNNFWNNLIDFRRKYPYKEAVFQGNASH